MSRVESFNPYETPRAEIAADGAGLLAGTSTRFQVGEVMSQAWAAYQARMGLSIGLFLLVVVLNFAAGLFQSTVVTMVQAVEPNRTTVVIVQVVSWLAANLFNFYINIGQVLTFLKIARGEPAQVSDLFAGGPFLLRLTVATVALGLATWLGMLVAAAPGGLMMTVLSPRDPSAVLLLVLGLFVGFLAVVAFWIRVSQYMFAEVDGRSRGAFDSIRVSTALTRGRFWAILGVYLLAILINIAGLLMLLVGFIFTFPLTLVVLAAVYDRLAGGPTAVKKPDLDLLG